MLAYLFCFILGSALGFFASEFADRWGCAQRYRSPMSKKIFITIMSGIAAACLYWWEVQNLMLLPHGLPPEVPNFATQAFALHIILFTFLLAATLTDFYEMIIPDTITVVGTIAALLFAYSIPLSGLPVVGWQVGGGGCCDGEMIGYAAMTLRIESPDWQAYDQFFLLFAMIMLWWFWCFAMLDRVWYTKLPFRKAAAIFCRYLYRSPRTKPLFYAALIAPPFSILAAFSFSDVEVFSALVGMAAGMILVWSVRLVAQWVLGVEAMGFGDVTLMGMIGAFLGWQAVLLVFFMAPFFGLVYGIVNAALGRGRAVPYGPFLCLATVVVVVAWSPIWSATAEYFAFGIGTIGLVLLGLLALFGGLLHIVHKAFAGLRR